MRLNSLLDTRTLRAAINNLKVDTRFIPRGYSICLCMETRSRV